ncbi:DUF5753 domain-containing protein [Actinoplanes solisilvae]|uniref:DUF5753 domain-containing protein n=1 Tax=Actinoplanes solisilvae TaxID=2486853 RepID=UPI001F0C28AF|nr:DUF5753 domain-containing protein [Actinoplanes solisilvae]
MSRSNQTGGIRRRCRFTGESYQLAYNETAILPRDGPLIPDASTAAQSIAEFIWEYNARLVSSLLRTREYAESALRSHHMSEGCIRELAELHTRRQSLILGSESSHVWAVLGYAAITGGPGMPDVMRRQIEFILNLTEHPSVSIQVLPDRHEGSATRNSFSLIRCGGTSIPDVIYSNPLGDEALLSLQEDTEPYRQTMAKIGIAAQAPAETRQILSDSLRGMNGR